MEVTYLIIGMSFRVTSDKFIRPKQYHSNSLLRLTLVTYRAMYWTFLYGCDSFIEFTLEVLHSRSCSHLGSN